MAVITLAGLALMMPDSLVMVVVGLVVMTVGFFAAHSAASGWVGARSAALGAQGAAVYLFCYYLGSSVGGSLGGLAYGRDGWNGVTVYTAAFIVLVLLIAVSLRRLVPLRRAVVLEPAQAPDQNGVPGGRMSA
jgi:YNFM family putative membrane transporter